VDEINDDVYHMPLTFNTQYKIDAHFGDLKKMKKAQKKALKKK
jgi:hypothetical protein